MATKEKTRGVVKVTVRLPADIVEAIDQRAASDSATFTNVLRRLLEREIFLEEESKKGTKILLEDTKGKMRQLITG